MEDIYTKMLIEFIIVYLVMFLFNYVFIVRKNKKYNKNKVPIELLYLLKVYKLDIKSINYKRFVLLSDFINSLIVSLVYVIVFYTLDNLILQIAIGIVLLILLIVICYGILGNYYVRKEEKKCTNLKK